MLLCKYLEFSLQVSPVVCKDYFGVLSFHYKNPNTIAGGFDAVFAIAMTSKAVGDVEHLWTTWQEMNVLPLILREDARGVF